MTGLSADYILGLSPDPNAVKRLRGEIALLHAAAIRTSQEGGERE